MNIAFVYRIIHALLAIMTLYFITQYLTLEEQGWYYTFLSFSALIYLFDFGLSIALVHVSSIEFVKLKWGVNGSIVGKSSKKYQEFINISFTKYLKIGVLYFIIILPFGLLFFNDNETAKNFFWHIPWTIHVILSVLSLLCLPYLSIIEGSGNIKEIYNLKIIQILIGSIMCCLLIYLKFPLLAPSMLLLSISVVTFLWLLFYRKNNLPKITNNSNHYSWEKNINSFKNKVGITFLGSYLFVQIYTPVLFYFEDPLIAGKFGLSLAIANMVGLISSSWFVTNIPSMTKYIAKNNYTDFNILFKKSFYQSTLFLLFLILFICSLYFIFYENKIFDRLLGFYNFIGILLYIFITHLINSIVIYIRCSKQEPLAIPHLLCSIITFAFGIYFLINYSILGLIASILVTQFFITLPVSLIGWNKYKYKVS
tara:strand:+ start:11325 stop:12599 length:1275 start_codon:yes stop_codon:yes gene_type:complete